MIINHGVPKIVSFDHDLGPEAMAECNRWKGEGFSYAVIQEKTGLDCVNFLVNYCFERRLSLPQYFCHSINSAGKANIISVLKNYEKIFPID